MTVSQTDRLTADDALLHPFLANAHQTPSPASTSDLLPLIKERFDGKKTFKRAIFTVRAAKMLSEGGKRLHAEKEVVQRVQQARDEAELEAVSPEISSFPPSPSHAHSHALGRIETDDLSLGERGACPGVERRLVWQLNRVCLSCSPPCAFVGVAVSAAVLVGAGGAGVAGRTRDENVEALFVSAMNSVPQSLPVPSTGALKLAPASDSSNALSVTKRLTTELMALMMEGPQGISAFPEDDADLTRWKGRLEGAEVSPARRRDDADGPGHAVRRARVRHLPLVPVQLPVRRANGPLRNGLLSYVSRPRSRPPSCPRVPACPTRERNEC